MGNERIEEGSRMSYFSRLQDEHSEFIEMAIKLRRYAVTNNLPKDLIVFGVAWDVRGLLEKKVDDFVLGIIQNDLT